MIQVAGNLGAIMAALHTTLCAPLRRQRRRAPPPRTNRHAAQTVLFLAPARASLAFRFFCTFGMGTWAALGGSWESKNTCLSHAIFGLQVNGLNYGRGCPFIGACHPHNTHSLHNKIENK